MAAPKTHLIEQPSASEVAVARSTSELLSQYVSTPKTEFKVVVDGDPLKGVTLPASMVRLLMEGLAEMGKGNAIRLVPQHAELTTQEAAELLNLSRPYVVRLLDEGKIPSHKVGTHRRVRLDDVLVYRQQSNAERLEALQNLVNEAQELDMGY